jgi:hypothetical protein
MPLAPSPVKALAVSSAIGSRVASYKRRIRNGLELRMVLTLEEGFSDVSVACRRHDKGSKACPHSLQVSLPRRADQARA